MWEWLDRAASLQWVGIGSALAEGLLEDSGHKFTLDPFPLLDLPGELATEVLRHVEPPFCLPFVCKKFMNDNFVWWLAYLHWNNGRAFRYTFESTLYNSTQPFQIDWDPLDLQSFPFRPDLDYRKMTGHSVKVPLDKLQGSWCDLDWTQAVYSPEKLNPRKGGRQFGFAPVILICSPSADYARLTMCLSSAFRPMAERVESELGLVIQQSPVLGNTGWPGWEQKTARAGEVELIAVAYGGSCPPGQGWDRYATQFKHTMDTYENLVGLVLVCDDMLGVMHQFNRFILDKFSVLLGDKLSALPILIMTVPSWTWNKKTTPPHEVPNQFLWYKQTNCQSYAPVNIEDASKNLPVPTAIFPAQEFDQGLRWLYYSRLSLLHAHKLLSS